MSWVTGPVLGLDTETTGVDVDLDRIVTAALVRRDATGTHLRTWLLTPDVEIPPAATAVHGITTEHARAHGRPASGALEEIADAVADAAAHGVPVVAFNAPFDLALLEAELRRHGLPTLVDRLGGEVSPVLDPLVLDRHLDGDRPGPRRLADLCAHYGVAAGALHTAEADVVATLDVLDAMARRFPHLAAMDAATAHRYGVTAQRAWAEGRAARRAAREAARRAAEEAAAVPAAAVGVPVRALLRRLPSALRGTGSALRRTASALRRTASALRSSVRGARGSGQA